MTAVAVVLTLVAGLAGAVQVAVMGRFGDRIGTLPGLAFAACVAAAMALVALVIARRSLSGFGDAARQPAWMWLGGDAGLALLAAGAAIALYRP